MRTLLYCTGYAPTLLAWTQRYRPWLDAVRRLGIADQIMIVDDGSPMLPGWTDVRVSSGPRVEDALAPIGPARAILHHFNHRLGRSGVFDCPGWYRSYGFGAAYALHHGFDRVVHLESDAFLLSERIRDHARTFTEGWAALWSERYLFPELAIQFAAGDGLCAMVDFTRQSYDCLIDRVHEDIVPFTHVERGFIGDRHGETNDPVPRGVDYICQIRTQREAPYYWWLPEGERYAADAVLEHEALTYDFFPGGDSDAIVGEGWSHAEGDFRWMTGYDSTLRLPPLPHPGSHVFRINVHPLDFRGEVIRHNLRVILNGKPVARFQIDGDLIVGTVLPGHLLRRDGSDIITLVHPDAIAPRALTDSTVDARELSVAIRHVALIPLLED